MRLLCAIGIVTLYVTINSYALPRAARARIPLSDNDKIQGQQLVLDLARNFSSFYFASTTFNHPSDRIISPLSFFIPLSLLSYGARGQTREIFLKALNFPKNKTYMAEFGYEKLLDKLAEYGVSVKTKMFIPAGVSLKPNFFILSTNVFHTEIEVVNVNDGLMESEKINAWVAVQTKNNVTELFKPQYIGRHPSIVLVNTVYFKGTWKKAFDSSKTAPRPFHPINGNPYDVPTMYTTGRFRHGRIDEFYFDFLELPYKSNSEDDGMSMFILVPDKREYLEWTTLVDTIKYMKLERLLNSTVSELEVYLPKFKIESEFSLTDYLNQFFAPAVEKRNKKIEYPKIANFSGIYRSAGLSNIGGQGLMKVVIEVDEGGQQTAQSSGIFYNATESAPSDRKTRSTMEPVQFKVDRPFLALVVTKGKILTDIFSINFPGIQFLPEVPFPDK